MWHVVALLVLRYVLTVIIVSDIWCINSSQNETVFIRGQKAGFGLEIYINMLFLAATKQLYEWFSPSVRPSVRLSVCLSVTPFWLCYRHRIMKFPGVITKDQGKAHARGQGQRSKVKVTEVTTQLSRFRTVTPVWIHIWWWNDAWDVPYCFLRLSVKFQGHTAKKFIDFDPNYEMLRNASQSLK